MLNGIHNKHSLSLFFKLCAPLFSFCFSYTLSAQSYTPALDELSRLGLPAEQRSSLVDAAIYKLATYKHTKINAAFQDTGDWKAYHQSLEEIAKSFPRGWGLTPGISILSDRVKERIELSTPPAIPVTAPYKLTPECERLLAELIEKPEAINLSETRRLLEEYGHTFPKSDKAARASILQYAQYYDMDAFSPKPHWLLNEPQEKSKLPYIALTESGWDGFLAFAFSLEDKTLTYEFQDSPTSVHFSNNSAHLRDMIYSALPRPLMRGELARNALLATLPNPENFLNEYDDEELKEHALEWKKKHEGKSRAALANVILQEAELTGNELKHPVEVILQSGADEDIKALKSLFLEAEKPITFQNLINRYFSHTEDPAYLDAYIIRLRDT